LVARPGFDPVSARFLSAFLANAEPFLLIRNYHNILSDFLQHVSIFPRYLLYTALKRSFEE
jgi:hypothetical protein